MSKPIFRYAAALLIFSASLVVRLLIFPAEAGFAFLTFYPATAMATLLCGSRAALVVVLGGFTGYYICMEPVRTFKFNYAAIIAMSVYAFSGALLCLIARAGGGIDLHLHHHRRLTAGASMPVRKMLFQVP